MSITLLFTRKFDPSTGMRVTSLLHEGMIYATTEKYSESNVVKSFAVNTVGGSLTADGVVMKTERRAFADENGLLYAQKRQITGTRTTILEAVYSPIECIVNTWKTELNHGIRTDFLETRSYSYELPEETSFAQYADTYLPSSNSARYAPKHHATFYPMKTVHDEAKSICEIAAANGLLEVIRGVDTEGLLSSELRKICIDLAAKHGHLHVVRGLAHR